AYGDAANWRAADGEAAAAAGSGIPGAGDAFADETSFRFDLGGGTRDAGRWQQNTWAHHDLWLRNGTMLVHGAWNLHGGTIRVEPDATLRFLPGSQFYPGVNDAATRFVEVLGRLELDDCRFPVYHVRMDVRPGGAFVADAAHFSIEGGQKSAIRVEGRADFPRGFKLEGSRWNGRLKFELAPGGVWALGGDVAENGNRVHVDAVLEGGTLDVARDCFFDVSDAAFADGANVEIRVEAGATADLSAFAGGSGVKIAKTGPGKLVLDAMPGAEVDLREGALALPETDPDKSGMTVLRGPGTAVESSAVAAPGVDLGRVLFQKEVATGEPLAIPLPADCIGRGDAEDGAVTLQVSSLRGRSSWRIPAKDAADVRLEWDGTALPLDSKIEDGAAGRAKSGDFVPLRFKFPEGAKARPASLALVLGGGVAGPARKTLLTVAKGVPKAEISVVADHTGRNYWIDASCFDGEAVRCKWYFHNPDGVPPEAADSADQAVAAAARAGIDCVETEAPRFRHRMPENADGPFKVRLEVLTRNFGVHRRDVVVTPAAKTLEKPSPNNDVMIGNCAYGDPTRLFSEEITNEICNLLVQWVGGDRLALRSRLDPAVAEKAHRDGLRSMTIYGHYGEDVVRPLVSEYGRRYLGNNIGEYAGYLYQTLKEAGNLRQDMDVIEAKEDFVNRFIRRGPGRDGQPHPFVFSTSGSPLATYELQGGIDYICNELYAVGSANLAYASSEARGAARRWRPDYWCSWLAEEWQTFPVPYGSDQKYDLLLAGYLQQYVMGTSLIVLESGAQGTQAHKYTAKDPGETRTGEIPSYGYDEAPPRRYRETTKKFHDFIRANPRDEGTPETKIAFALGNGDAFVGMTTDWFAVWAQHKQAETNSNWRCGLPEQTWLQVKDSFFPVPGDALRPYPNYWLAGSPFGQVDVVSVDHESRVSDLSRYDLVSFAGWNTMTPQARAVLLKYAAAGGTVAICLPHFSTRRDREYRDYSVSDLLPLPGGASVTGGPVTAEGSAADIEYSAAAPAGMKAAVAAPGGNFSIRVAPLELPAGAEVLVSFCGRPLVVRFPVGKGSVVLLAAWDYPGNSGALSRVYDGLVRSLAAAVPQRVSIAPAPGMRDDTRYICFSCYGKKAYLLNVDCVGPRTVELRIRGREPRVVEIAPRSVTVVDL
ncbi:MAG: hypothetical protein IJ783_09850, partial [Kiritimatiellae bacterium]|nr:hypothetical protein [Kiritimatiellia bacterium]